MQRILFNCVPGCFRSPTQPNWQEPLLGANICSMCSSPAWLSVCLVPQLKYYLQIISCVWFNLHGSSADWGLQPGQKYINTEPNVTSNKHTFSTSLKYSLCFSWFFFWCMHDNPLALNIFGEMQARTFKGTLSQDCVFSWSTLKFCC